MAGLRARAKRRLLVLHRRRLSAALALDLLPRLEEEARERQLSGLKQGEDLPVSPETDERGRADEKAAELVGIGRTTVATAKAIQKRAPEVIVTDHAVARAVLRAGAGGAAGTVRRDVRDAVRSALREGRSSRRVPAHFSRSRVAYRLGRGERIAWSRSGEVAYLLQQVGGGWRVLTVLPRGEWRAA